MILILLGNWNRKSIRKRTEILNTGKLCDYLQAIGHTDMVFICGDPSASKRSTIDATEQIKSMDFINGQDAREAMVFANIDSEVKKSRKLTEQLSELSSAALLFIDLKNDPGKDYSLIKSIHIDISKLGKLSAAVFEIVNKYEMTSEKFVDDQHQAEYKTAKRAFEEQIQKISDSYIEMKNRINRTIEEVRNDIKTFNI